MSDEAELRALVERIVADVLEETGIERAPARHRRSRAPLPPALARSAIDRIKRASPARLAQGRVGTRYLTDVYVGLRADHAIALDAVNSEVPEDFAATHGWLELHSRCETHDEFLLQPGHGRRLNDASREKLAAQGERGTDIQIIAGDGLSAMALMENGPPLVEALLRELPKKGFKVAKPVFAKFARVGLQDEVGVLLDAKATIILVGERPGLGTGDSLSIYTAYRPRLDQDNSEKDCISNVRGLGYSPQEAAVRCADLMRRTFDAGGGGVNLV